MRYNKSHNYIRSLLILVLFCGCKPSVESSKTASEGDFTQGKNVAFLVMDGTFNTELTAPYDILHHTRFREGIEPFHVFTIAQSPGPITTFEGLKIEPDYWFRDGDYPKIDILIVPAAEHHLDSDLENESLVNFVRDTGEHCDYIISLCDGAFLLAKAGILNNHVCTTFPGDIDELRQRYPELDIREDVLWVHDGKVITGAGGAKSFEPAMYLVELLFGREIAVENGIGMVIDWAPDSLKWVLIE